MPSKTQLVSTIAAIVAIAAYFNMPKPVWDYEIVVIQKAHSVDIKNISTKQLDILIMLLQDNRKRITERKWDLQSKIDILTSQGENIPSYMYTAMVVIDDDLLTNQEKVNRAFADRIKL